MFLNANTGAKLAQQYAAQIQAKKKAKARAEAKANGLEVDENPCKKPSKKSKEPNDGSTVSAWLSERNDKLRSDAIKNVQSAITKQDERKGLLSSTMEHLVEVAQARLQCCNERGVILTMKKVIACQAEQEHFAETIEALEKLFLDIGSCDVKPEGHEKKIKVILALPVKKKAMSDDEMLKELKKLTEEEK